MRDKEYDAFGPWIIEIKEKEDIPPLFRASIDDNKEKILAIKIPRQIDRRSAQPGMDLYDCVIIMYEEHMHILKRDEKRVISKEIEYKKVCAIKNKRELLNNLFTIYLPDEVVSIKYTVSGEIINKTIDFLRSKYLVPNESTITRAMNKRDINITSFYYSNMLKILEQKEDQIQVLAFQPKMKVKRIKRIFSGKIKISYKSLLQSSLFVTNNKELILLNRANLMKGFRDVDYSYVYTYIPIDKIKAISLMGVEDTEELNNIDIQFGSFSFQFPIDVNQKDLDVYQWCRK